MFSAVRCLLPLFVASLPALAHAAEWVLQGPDEMVEWIQPHLPDDASAAAVEKLAREILSTEGYFSPLITLLPAEVPARLTLEPGIRSRITAATITVDGKMDAKLHADLVAGWALPVGQPFRQADWDKAKQQLLRQLLAADYAGAKLLDSVAEIDPEQASARLTAHYAAGPRYRIGSLRIEGLARYQPALVGRYNRLIAPGDAYRESALGSLQSILQASPYFTSVKVSIDPDNAQGDDEVVDVPLLIQVRERPAHRLSFGAGVSSNTGARVAFNYQTPHLFNQPWVLDSGIRLEQKRQLAYGDVFLPPDAENRRHSLGVMLENTNIQGLRSDRQAFGVQSVQQRGSIEQRLALQWQREQLRPASAEASTSTALVPNMMWTWRQVDDPLDPQQGFVLQAQVGGGSKALLSDQNFIRLYSRYQQFIPLGRDDSVVLRAELGYTVAESRAGIPQDYLFRTGGASSVRGYPYQSLGVAEGNAVVGGRYLGVLSLEATHWIDPVWGIAAFVDAGDAVDAWRDHKAALGYGLGARWRSPAGPLGIDLAYGQRIAAVNLHFSLAIPF